MQIVRPDALDVCWASQADIRSAEARAKKGLRDVTLRALVRFGCGALLYTARLIVTNLGWGRECVDSDPTVAS